MIVLKFSGSLSYLSIGLIFTLIHLSTAHSTIEEAKAVKYSAIKKHHKRLNKQDGAIRLVGGEGEFEGERVRHICRLHEM